jgi:acyl-CoA thioester hydrolase
MSASANLPDPLPEGFSTPGTAESPFTILQPVAWGEMDALGHVNNAVYLRWMENVRFHYFEMVGINALLAEDQKGPILARAEIDFLAPVTFPDDLLLSTRTVRLGNSSFTLENRIWSLAQGKLVATGDAIIVMVDYALEARSVRVPEPIRAAIRALDGESLDDG